MGWYNYSQSSHSQVLCYILVVLINRTTCHLEKIITIDRLASPNIIWTWTTCFILVSRNEWMKYEWSSGDYPTTLLAEVAPHRRSSLNPFVGGDQFPFSPCSATICLDMILLLLRFFSIFFYPLFVHSFHFHIPIIPST